MSAKSVMAKVVVGHDGSLDYHEWWFSGESVKVDRRGRPNPRMIFADALMIKCNNPDCGAWGFVRESAITALLDEVRS